MPPKLTQKDRQFRLETPLGADALVLVKWKGEERVSSLFHFEVEALSENRNIDPNDLLTKTVTLHIELPEGGERAICGIVNRFARGGTTTEGHTWYTLHIVPPQFVLTLGEYLKPYQEKTTRDILSDALKGTQFQFHLTKTYKPRAYCFLYQESWWNFVSRLLEQEGIWYSFKHEPGTVTLEMFDSMASVALAGPPEALFYQEKTEESQTVQTFNLEYAIHQTGSLLRTYSEYAVGVTLEKQEDVVGGSMRWTPSVKYVQYLFEQQLSGQRTGTAPGGTERQDAQSLTDEVSRLARVRQEEAETDGKRVAGRSTYRSFAAGTKIKMAKHPEASLNAEYFLTAVRHYGHNGAYLAGDKTEQAYENEFEGMPMSIPFRPARVAEWPRALSTHVAVVTGPAGEEIFTDKYMRVRVDFRWNPGHAIKNDEGIWLRIAQPFAGQTFGAVFIPRIGHEVLVTFLDGNPDNPVIVGSLYSDVNMPPYELPANKTQSGLKTKSTLNGGGDEFNELRFEDKKGSEHINVQAQKDLMTLVKNDETRTVKNNRTTVIHMNDKKTVEKENDTTIVKEGDMFITIETGNRVIDVKTDQTVTIGEDHTFKVDGKQDVTIKKNHTFTVTDGDMKEQVKMGKLDVIADMGNMKYNAKMGNIDVKADLGKITVEAMQSIELKVGANSIKIDMIGVTIKGTIVSVEGTAMTKVKAPMTMVNGDGMLMLKGGITMIN